MPIIGYTLKKVNFSKKEIPSTLNRVDISSTARIVEVKERPIPIFENKPYLVVGFEFKTEYKPEVALAEFAGEIIYSSKDNKKILKSWHSEKKLPKEVDIEIKNFIFKRCLTLGINISSEMQLPAPVAFPLLTE
jgi:hypothetical protein